MSEIAVCIAWLLIGYLGTKWLVRQWGYFGWLLFSFSIATGPIGLLVGVVMVSMEKKAGIK